MLFLAMLSTVLCNYIDAGYLVSIYQRLLGHVWEVWAASWALEEAFDKHTPTPDLNGKSMKSLLHS